LIECPTPGPRLVSNLQAAWVIIIRSSQARLGGEKIKIEVCNAGARAEQESRRGRVALKLLSVFEMDPGIGITGDQDCLDYQYFQRNTLFWKKYTSLESQVKSQDVVHDASYP
jgi:hypothetical protein